MARAWISIVLGTLLLVACGDKEESNPIGSASGGDGSTDTADPGDDGGSGDDGSTGDDGGSGDDGSTGDEGSDDAGDDGDDAGDDGTTTDDADGDGYGVDEDCDDSDPDVNPGATEECDGIDNDCDTLIDDADDDTDPASMAEFHADLDGDGYGDPDSIILACTPTDEALADDSDCDDTDAAISPDASEVCDELDNDCDGAIDDADPSLDTSTRSTFFEDADLDGYGWAGSTQAQCSAGTGWSADDTDCDDTNGTIHPGATETCNTVDDNCDGLVDSDDPLVDLTTGTTFYADADADGFGDSATTTQACDVPSGYSADDSDCDDTDAAINPLADEVCDTVDNDCDTLVDDDDPGVDLSTVSFFFADADADGFGDPTSTFGYCVAPSGFTTDATDCDDTDATIYPGATEVCDAADNDCDGAIDDDDADLDTSTGSTFYVDADLDGYGDPSLSGLACTAPSGAVSDNTDCDDADADINPGASEICDGYDNDCDGDIDADDASVDTSTSATYYQDADGDGYGITSSTTTSCSVPSGYAVLDGDCDDTDATLSPGATEVCDAADNDCDGLVDDDDDDVSGTGSTTYYLDLDGDGYGDPDTEVGACSAPGGAYVTDGTDCDDTSADAYPGGSEVCDGLDNDCDGDIDADDSSLDTSTANLYYLDADADGYGLSSSSSYACTPPSGYAATDGDCDDTNPAISPGAVEICDTQDNDCDGDTDDADADIDQSTQVAYFADADVDGYGDASSFVFACAAPSGAVTDDTDCDDTDAAVNPAASEVCDGVDNDCDGDTDDDDLSLDATTASTYYADTDADGYGDPSSSVVACSLPSGHVSDNTDCEDDDATINPLGTEVCDGEDNDCDGDVDSDDSDISATETATWYLDADGDGFGDATTTTTSCSQPSGYEIDGTDCDDTDAGIHPDAEEVCDSIDNDCDSLIDDDDTDVASTSGTATYTDADADGYGDDDTVVYACTVPSGAVTTGGDCDDADATISPAASEVCDGIDNNCNDLTDDDDGSSLDVSTAIDWYVDSDADSYGDSTISLLGCDLSADGYVTDADDCDDTDAAVNPGASEVCDGTDNDCDGDIDDSDASLDVSTTSTFYTDSDRDGYGDPTAPLSACVVPVGASSDGTDCDDTTASVNPGQTEVCDAASTDEDCNGLADDADPGVDGSTTTTIYRDNDADGYGDTTSGTAVCLIPTGAVLVDGDCDDTDGAIHPTASEVCDGDDNDCNGLTDDDDAGLDTSTAATWYADLDADGYGDASSSTLACDLSGSGYTADATDCDDTSAVVNPGASEVCDSVDNDCDGATDDADTDIDQSTQVAYYADVDADGYGDASFFVYACSAPSGAVTDDTDCDDADATINPAASEVCDSLDNDCDGLIDDDDPSIDSATQTTLYADADADGFGDPSVSVVACSSATGLVSDNTDCDDTNATAYPGGTEVCDGADNDCDTLVDADDPDVPSSEVVDWYTDADGDGYGDASSSTSACNQPSGHVIDATDCDDTDATVSPGATEVCDAIDNDCDSLVDDDDTDVDTGSTTTFYTDADADGYGDPTTGSGYCAAPSGTVSDSSDCDDTDAAVHPAATEVCDGTDNDCNTLVDDDDPGLDTTTQITVYADLDGDSYGDPSASTLACTAETGFTTDNTDCDDAAPSTNPGADELCDGTDNDCDGLVDADDSDLDPSLLSDWYLDADGDGWGDPTVSTTDCSQPSGYVSSSDDCDDTDATLSPDATETCDGIDNDCDGLTDDDDTEIDPSSATEYWADSDADGYGDPTTGTLSCTAPSGTVTDDTDCDDTDATVNPAASEVCDGIDNDCDTEIDDEDTSLDTSTQITVYTDADTDGFGDATSSTLACTAEVGFSTDDTDCDDTDATVYPTAPELCDSLDNDCDTLVDTDDPDMDPALILDWYADADADGYGDPAVSTTDCAQPSGYVASDADCDDTDATISPDATEVCDSIDNDCDSLVDDDDTEIDLTTTTTYFTDADADGYGDPSSGVAFCVQPSGTVTDDTDCDDADAAVNPVATEVCDGIDNDCDTEIDDDDASIDSSTQSTFYADTDGDGYGDATSTTLACTVASGLSTDDTDCDDTNATVYPTAEELCDGIDNDCDALVDTDDSDMDPALILDWYADADGDGFGDATVSTTDCAQPSGYVSADTDCDDTDATISPDASEVCDSIDNDCDTLVDDDDTEVDLTTTVTYYNDSDADGYGDASTGVALCLQPTGTVTDGSDCDDADAAISPAATEVCDSVDNDCDGDTDDDDAGLDTSTASNWYPDTDADDYGDSSAAPTLACDLSATGYTSDDSDCDDTTADVYPGAAEVCDGQDNDCDLLVDDDDASLDTTTQSTFYADADADGFGDSTVSSDACTQPSGYTDTSTDCDDTDASVNPGATEICDAASTDEDCNGLADDDDAGLDTSTATTVYLDSDGDGYGDSASSADVCIVTSGYVTVDGDCDDIDATINPGASEVCDDEDNDCDGLVDDDDSSVDLSTVTDWYPDADGDGYGTTTGSTTACNLSASGYAILDADCDDTDATVNPGAAEICDSQDNDCDGLTDDDDTDVDSSSGTTHYADADGDTYGDSSVVQVFCSAPSSGWSTTDGDCDDTDSAIRPGATEVCDSEDNDCDGFTDEDDPGISRSLLTTFYSDRDGDGYGDPLGTEDLCFQSSDTVTNADDCDDTSALVNPDGRESCNGDDDDCDGTVDEAHLDDDLDGSAPSGLTFNGDAAHSFFGTDGYVDLTQALTNQGSTAWFSDLIDGSEFYAEYEVYLGNSSSGADGVAFFIADSGTSDTYISGYGDTFGADGIDGYAIAIDTFQNGTDPTATSGNFIGLYELDATAGWTLLDSDVTLPNLEDGSTHLVTVSMDEGALEVSVDGTTYLVSTISGYSMADALIGWGAGTGGATAYQNVDDLYLGCEVVP